jgi:hypothetical protein
LTNSLSTYTLGVEMSKLLLLASIVLTIILLGGKSLKAETTPDSIRVCAEIVYQGYIHVRKIVKVDPKAESTVKQVHLNGLVREAQFFKLPEVISSPTFDGCCDRNFPNFRVTVETYNNRHTVVINTQNTIPPNRLAPLLHWLEDRATPPGGALGRSTNERCPALEES